MFILAPYYHYIYLLIGTIALFIYLRQPASVTINGIEETKTIRKTIPIIIFFILFIGMRPMSREFGDTLGYLELYRYWTSQPCEISLEKKNFIFDNLIVWFASQSIDFNFFLLFISLIYFSCIAIACNKLFKGNAAITIAAYLTAFSTYAYAVNGFKAGAAAAIFLVAVAYKDKLWLAILLALVSVGFHHSMRVVAVAFAISYFCRRTGPFFLIWVLSLVVALLHIEYFQNFFIGLGDESANGYLIPSEDLIEFVGFRPDFVFYSAFPVLSGYVFYFKRNIRNSEYELWLRLYLLTNSIWMLCMYSSYTNRIAYLSWFLYPIVLLYPYFAMYYSPDQVEKGTIVAKCQVFFTLFMELLFYNYIK